MDAERATVWGVVAVVVVTTLVSGPLVGAVDLTTESGPAEYGNGSVSVESVSLPDRATLTAGRFGAGEYTLRVPDATVELSAVEGRPIMVYKLSIPERGYTRSTTHFLSERDAGRLAVSLADDSFDPETVDADSYEGELELLVRADGADRVVANATITVEVRA